MPTSTLLGTSLLSDLNPVQKQAVVSTEGPTLILAGAGSGKTKALTHRVAYLIAEKHIPPENILCLTFTNKAAGEMMDRIHKLLNNSGAKPMMGTFHSFCARILRCDGKHIGLPPTFSIYDEDDAQDAVKQAMASLDLSTQKTSPSTIRNTISGAKNEMISALEYPSIARGYFQETAAKIYLKYQEILEKNKAVDFDDLLLLVVKLFQNHPEVLAKYQIQFRYVLIDEYQDTNAVQYLLSKLLSNRYKNICVVGDASQSIYRFRGADFRNIVNFQKDYPNAKVFNLEQNYRSTQTILDAAFAVISQNRSHPILKLWTDNPTGAKIQVVETRNEVEEALFIAKTVQELNLPLNSFAILYRTNAQSRALEEVFLKSGLPYVLVGGIRFYARKEIKDMLAYLRLLTHPQDSVSSARIEKIGKNRAAKFRAWAETVTVNLNKKTTLELLDQIVEVTDYLSYIDDGTEVGKSKVENVKELRSVADQFPNLVEFLENVTLVEKEYFTDEKLKHNRLAITLTTLHQAKGLEWPVVFIVGMEEGLFPHSRCLLDPGEMEEERRLCYVGITRAKQQLFLTYARQRLFFGTRSNNLVSRFLTDLPQNIIESNAKFQDVDKENQYLTDDDDWLNA
ncbi:UvrD-helicase domain-containing protein [Candidatus Daviesbacteria bacterium]|nr:UvrD-helicase domain-containing protein [Candidatus Daviesbacteria bacterium]